MEGGRRLLISEKRILQDARVQSCIADRRNRQSEKFLLIFYDVIICRRCSGVAGIQRESTAMQSIGGVPGNTFAPNSACRDVARRTGEFHASFLKQATPPVAWLQAACQAAATSKNTNPVVTNKTGKAQVKNRNA